MADPPMQALHTPTERSLSQLHMTEPVVHMTSNPHPTTRDITPSIHCKQYTHPSYLEDVLSQDDQVSILKLSVTRNQPVVHIVPLVTRCHRG